jgi:hypothetical protein
MNTSFLSSDLSGRVDYTVYVMPVTYVAVCQKETSNEERKIETKCYDVGGTKLSELFPKMATERRL